MNCGHSRGETTACYLRANRANDVVAVDRWIWLKHPHETQPVRILFALLSQGKGAIEALSESALQKFIIRQVKMLDDVVKGRSKRAGTSAAPEKVGEQDDDEDDDESSAERFVPKVQNPLYLLAYGCLLMLSKSWQSAISSFAVLSYFSSLTSMAAQSTCFERTIWLRVNP